VGSFSGKALSRSVAFQCRVVVACGSRHWNGELLANGSFYRADGSNDHTHWFGSQGILQRGLDGGFWCLGGISECTEEGAWDAGDSTNETSDHGAAIEAGDEEGC
jgi:hypothetical protein